MQSKLVRIHKSQMQKRRKMQEQIHPHKEEIHLQAAQVQKATK